jgi:hypothetical protein
VDSKIKKLIYEMEIYAEEFGKRGYYLDKQIDNE